MKSCRIQLLMISMFSLWVSGALAFMWMMHKDWGPNHGVEPIYQFGAWGLFIVAVSSWGYMLLNCIRNGG